MLKNYMLRRILTIKEKNENTGKDMKNKNTNKANQIQMCVIRRYEKYVKRENEIRLFNEFIS